MLAFIESNIVAVLAAVLILTVIMTFAFLLAMLEVRRLKNKFDRFMRPNSKNHNLELQLTEYLEEVREIKAKNDGMFEDIEDIKRVLKTGIQKIGIVKYNTLEEIGGELSYAIALLDQNDSGIVLNSLYYRDGCYTYAKQIIAGDCLTPLSEEEQQAIVAARDNSSNIVFKERMIIKKRKRELLRLKGTKKGAKENV
ncbi:MAG: DUF4446 family protein [Firmicutes bacterium]|nr:DUF4446 family protein [Bacillota bacterium]